MMLILSKRDVNASEQPSSNAAATKIQKQEQNLRTVGHKLSQLCNAANDSQSFACNLQKVTASQLPAFYKYISDFSYR